MSANVAKRYAKALARLGHEDGNLELYGRELSDFLDGWQAYPELRTVLTNPVFSLVERKNVLEDVLTRGRFSKGMKNFLYLLLEKERLARVVEIGSFFQRLKDEILHIARVTVVSARPLKKESRIQLTQVLENWRSQTVAMETREDRSLVGGILVKIGDLVLDGSIKSQLLNWQESVKKREKTRA